MTSRKDTERLAAIFVKAGLIDDLQVRSAMAKMDNWGGRITRVLAESGFAEEEDLTEALSKALGVPVAHLGNLHKDPAVLHKLDAGFCEEHSVFPISFKDRTLTVAIVDPSELDVVDAVKSRSGGRVQLMLASETEIKNAILVHYRNQPPKVMSNRARKAVKRTMTDEDFKLDVDASRPPAPQRVNTQESPLRRSTGNAFSQEQLAKLEVLRANQSKAGTILKAVEELLGEKGILPHVRG